MKIKVHASVKSLHTSNPLRTLQNEGHGSVLYMGIPMCVHLSTSTSADFSAVLGRLDKLFWGKKTAAVLEKELTIVLCGEMMD